MPTYLLVDPQADPAMVTVFSRPSEEGYLQQASAPFGEKLALPEPVDFMLDTALLPA